MVLISQSDSDLVSIKSHGHSLEGSAYENLGLFLFARFVEMQCWSCTLFCCPLCNRLARRPRLSHIVSQLEKTFEMKIGRLDIWVGHAQNRKVALRRVPASCHDSGSFEGILLHRFFWTCSELKRQEDHMPSAARTIKLRTTPLVTRHPGASLMSDTQQPAANQSDTALKRISD